MKSKFLRFHLRHHIFFLLTASLHPLCCCLSHMADPPQTASVQSNSKVFKDIQWVSADLMDTPVKALESDHYE